MTSAAGRPTASLGIPAFNEAAGMEKTIRAVTDALLRVPSAYDWELIIVDDGSTDGTAETVERAALESPVPVRLLVHPVNRGLGCALTTLFRATPGSLLVVLDADLSYDEGHIEKLVRGFETTGASVVVASPYGAGGRTIAIPAILELRSRLANWYLRAMSRQPIHTFTSMVRAYDGPFVRTLAPLTNGPSANVVVLAEAWRQGLHVAEVSATLDWTTRTDRRERTVLFGRRSRADTMEVIHTGLKLLHARRRANWRFKAPDAASREPLVEDGPRSTHG